MLTVEPPEVGRQTPGRPRSSSRCVSATCPSGALKDRQAGRGTIALVTGRPSAGLREVRTLCSLTSWTPAVPSSPMGTGLCLGLATEMPSRPGPAPLLQHPLSHRSIPDAAKKTFLSGAACRVGPTADNQSLEPRGLPAGRLGPVPAPTLALRGAPRPLGSCNRGPFSEVTTGCVCPCRARPRGEHTPRVCLLHNLGPAGSVRSSRGLGVQEQWCGREREP